MSVTEYETTFSNLDTITKQVDNDFDSGSFIIAAVNLENGKFGTSIFINGEVKILKEDKNGFDRDLFDMLSVQETELEIISSTRSNILSLKQSLPQGAAFQLVPSADFSLLTADEIESEFCIEINQDDCTKSNESSFKSLNALLVHLSKFIPREKMPKNVGHLRIESTIVSISKSCLQALQIFDFEPHPNMHATNQGLKEGCSIFSLFNQAVSEEGRAKLKKWFQNPTNNLRILKSRQDSIESLLKSDMSSFTKSVAKSLKKCIRISHVLNDLKFRSDANDLMKIERFCESFHEIYSQAHDQTTSSFHLIEMLRSADFSPIFALSHLIRRIIDVEKFKTSEINTVREHVSSNLDILRRKYGNLPDFLNSIVSEIAQGINSSQVEAVNIVYFPQLGFLITLPMPKPGIDPTALGNQLNFELQFQSNKICYYKNDKMRQLDENIGDVYADIIDAQLEIMQKIVNEAVACENLLKEALEICSELDCLISLSKTAQMYSLNRPEIVNDPSLFQIEDGRHLLVELYSNRQCIANDCNLSGDQTKIIITGANSSGKSVYLKQVGIIAFLAHIGSFVPARSARIGLIDRITTRIRTVESSGKGESCFMIDLKQVKGICETATEKSLILIDEFGKGTSETNGMALFSGLLSYFSRMPVRLFAITHMYEVFRRQLIPEAEKYFKFGHMKVFPDKTGLCYLYKLTDGLGAEESFAIECAHESGIPEKVINQALNVLQELKNRS